MVEARAAGPEERTAAMATLTLAFCADPPTRWMLPGADEFLEFYPRFAQAFGGRAFDHKTAFVTSEGKAAALWLPPGVSPDEPAMDAFFKTLAARRGERAQADAAQAGEIGERMAAFHPREPHWYLPLIGVDPAAQGKGLGSALMKQALARVDADHLPAYLESSNARNVPLYERFGFEVQGFIQAGGFPGLWPMLRAAR